MTDAERKAALELELALAALDDANRSIGLTDEARQRRGEAIGRARARIEMAVFRLTGRFPASAQAFARDVLGMLERGETRLPEGT